MGEIERTERYLFILGVLLLFFAYWAGANKLLGTTISGINTIDLTATGRTASGQFAAYPSGGPTS